MTLHEVKTLNEAIAIIEARDKEIKAYRNVLAVIHRDGGRYIKEHGYEKASSDAMEIVLKGRRSCPNYPECGGSCESNPVGWDE